jgi:hypothetical protein
MSTKQYITLVLEEELINKLNRLAPDKASKDLITEAIVEYIRNRTFIPNQIPYVKPEGYFISGIIPQ